MWRRQKRSKEIRCLARLLSLMSEHGNLVSAEGQSPLVSPIVAFDYKLENRTGWDRCASRVVFDSFSKVTVVSHFPPPLD